MDELDKIPEAETTPAESMTPESSPVEVPAEEVAPVKFSDTFRNKIKSAYPDQEFPDDEAFFQKASEQLDNLEQYRNNNMEANKALMEIFASEPVVVEILKDMIEGASFRAAIARHFSPEELMPEEGEPDREAWKRNAESRAKRLEDNEKLNKTRAENDELSSKAIAEFAQETGLDPDKASEFLNVVGEALDEVYAGKISKSFLQSMYRALNYDNDIKTAEANGTIKGRNEKIETKKQERPKGDGLPSLGNGKSPETPAPKKDWVSNLIDSEKKKQIL